jgi:peroxiredoxin
VFLKNFKSSVLSQLTIIVVFFLLLGVNTGYSQIPTQQPPDFTLKDVNVNSATHDQNVSLSSFAGRVTVLFFFQTADENSISVATAVESQIYAPYASECSVVIGISGFIPSDSEATVTTFAQNNNLNFPVLYDQPSGGSLTNMWQTYNTFTTKNSAPILFVVIDNAHSTDLRSVVVAYDSFDYENSGSSSTIADWFSQVVVESLLIAGGGGDITQPTIDSITPADGATLAQCEKITIQVHDDCAVDANSAFTKIMVNNTDVTTTAKWNPPLPSNKQFRVIIPIDNFFASPSINLDATFADMNGNIINSTATYTPATETDPPVIANNIPGDAVDVPITQVISVDIYDNQSCIDETSIVMKFGSAAGIPTQVTDLTLTPLTDGNQGFNVSYDPTPDLNPNSTYVYSIEASNLNGMQFSQNFTFTTTSQQALPLFAQQTPRGNNASAKLVSFEVTQNTEGIDQNSISLTLNGIFKSPLNFTVIQNGFKAEYVPADGELTIGSSYTAIAQASTPSGITNSTTWSFTIGDPNPPEFSQLVPGSIKTASANTPISFIVSDETAVDRNSIQLFVNKVDVTSQSAILPFAPRMKEYNVYYKPTRSFNLGETVRVQMLASDTQTPQNSNNEQYSFTVQTGPSIKWAGYLDTFISAKNGGFIKIIARTSDPKDLYGDSLNPSTVTGSNIVGCELFNPYEADLSKTGSDYYDSSDSLITLKDDPSFLMEMGLGNFDKNNDGLYVFFTRMIPGIPQGQWRDTFAIQAWNSTNPDHDYTDPWPYFTVEQGGAIPSSYPTDQQSSTFNVQSKLNVSKNPLTYEQKFARILIDSTPEWDIEAFNWINSSSFDKEQMGPGFYPPMIYVAGIEPARFVTGTTDTVTVRAFVYDPDNDIKSVKLLQGGNLETGIELFDDGLNNDFAAGDFWFGKDLNTNITPGFYKLEIVAEDTYGLSHIFPYITVDP